MQNANSANSKKLNLSNTKPNVAAPPKKRDAKEVMKAKEVAGSGGAPTVNMSGVSTTASGGKAPPIKLTAGIKGDIITNPPKHQKAVSNTTRMISL